MKTQFFRPHRLRERIRKQIQTIQKVHIVDHVNTDFAGRIKTQTKRWPIKILVEEQFSRSNIDPKQFRTKTCLAANKWVEKTKFREHRRVLSVRKLCLIICVIFLCLARLFHLLARMLEA